MRLLSLFFALFLSCGLIAQISQRSLSQEEWQFKNTTKENWMPAEVPGTVHTDLMANEIIPDPFKDRNEDYVQWNENVERKVRWVEDEDWEYKTTFTISAEELENDQIDLVFDGLDTFAEVFLNGESILNANNMFRQWSVPVKLLLKEGENILELKFKSPIKEGDRQAERVPFETPESPRAFVRKAQYQFGWDWGPRLPTSGIWKDVYLNFWNKARLQNVQIVQKKLTPSKGDLDFNIEIEVKETGRYSIVLNGKSKGKFNLKKGTNTVQISERIHQPQWWQPNGWGEPHLYDFEVVLQKDDKELDETKVRHGFRTVKLIREKDPDGKGESFYFEVNGHPLYVKGANWIPGDSFLPRMTKEKYDQFIADARKANMNMLRIWGGGIYENDEFYNAADENGILIWQDFMFAGTFYPSDESFLNNIRAEVKYQVKRLENHPSIAIWAGNNEIREAIAGWGYQKMFGYSEQDSLQVWKDYHTIFEEVIPNALSEVLGDQNYIYLPSSPVGHAESRAAAADGDSHYWGVWHNYEPFEAFENNVGRFVSEFGFQGMPSLETIEAMFSQKTDLNDITIFNRIVRYHEKDDYGWDKMYKIMHREYKIPYSFIHYNYVSQLLQARALQVGLETFRRYKPYNMGSLVWQFNDVWPVTSWSAVDYRGNWKALMYQMEHSFAPQIILAHEEGDEIQFIAINDALESFDQPQLEITIKDFEGNILKQMSKTFNDKELKEITKTEAVKTASILPDNADKHSIFMEMTVTDKPGNEIAHNLYFFAKPKDLQLTEPHIQIRHVDDKTIEVSTDKLAKNVYLMGPGNYSDNFFDLLPGETRTITVPDKGDEVKAISLWDTLQDYN